MAYNEFKLCKKCPVKGARYFDPDGYWVCKHPENYKHQYPERDCKPYEEGDEIPFVCMKTCPCGHWKRTIEGGLIPKKQTELVVDAEYMATAARADDENKGA